MKPLLLSGSALLVASLAANAADMPVKAQRHAVPAVAPIHNWSGFYVGGHIGGAWSHSDFATQGPAVSGVGAIVLSSIIASGTGSASDSSLTGGAQVGYNYQVQNWVFGLEADISFLNLSNRRSSAVFIPTAVPSTATTTSAVEADWLATVRGRVGHAFGPLLIYGTGGLALTEFEYSNQFTFATSGPIPVEPPIASSKTRAGWTAGGGLEWAFAPSWSAKFEYLYADFGTREFNTVWGAGLIVGGGQPLIRSGDLTLQLARVGLNYKF